jgi:hypothetical protein
LVVKIRVRHRIDRLADDYAEIPRQATLAMARIVRDNADLGRDLARALARESAGRHGKHYPGAITSESTSGLGLFGNTHSAEFGPDVNRKQGGMSFDRGSRNQPPHNDLAQSADKVGPSMAADVRKLLTRLYS